MSNFIAQAAPANPFGNEGIAPVSPRFEVDLSSAEAANASSLSNLELFISQLIGFLTVGASLFFIIYFIMGAFKWTTAGGDSGKVQKARDQMIQGAMGLILIVAAYSVMGIIGTVLGVEILQPANTLRSIVGPIQN